MTFDPQVEAWRIRDGNYKSPKDSPFGAFVVPSKFVAGTVLFVIADNGKTTNWEHVSVSLPTRCPSWEEMNYIKDLFFGDDCTVIQFHPKKAAYVNKHPHCLHLWRRKDKNMDLPPEILV